jgi:hypothetical protein
VHTGFGWGDLTEGDHLKDLGIDGRIILKWIVEKWVVRVDWIDVAQYGDRWRAVVNSIIRFHKMRGISCD